MGLSENDLITIIIIHVISITEFSSNKNPKLLVIVADSNSYSACGLGGKHFMRFQSEASGVNEIHDWYCFQKWRNLLLTWDPEKYGGIKRVRINPSLIWIPDIVLYNRSVQGVTN